MWHSNWLEMVRPTSLSAARSFASLRMTACSVILIEKKGRMRHGYVPVVSMTACSVILSEAKDLHSL
ncbi:MAG: hypothetical protein NVSMB27_25960 [Ktedonobacteraceae bacterium]